MTDSPSTDEAHMADPGMDDARMTEVFFDVQRGLPRQGPGDDASTARALALCGDLPEAPDVLDIGCGPGMQTIALAQRLRGTTTALDLHEEYLDQLRASAVSAGVEDRIWIVRADMRELSFTPGSFDLIWSEGAAYIMGVGRALAAWRPLLRPGGHLALTELTWLGKDRPAEAVDFFAREYPAMGDVAAGLARIEASGYRVVGHFTLPDSAWWEHYYAPLEAKLPSLRAAYVDDAAALEIVESAATEIDMRRRFGHSYGYEFFVARRD